MAREYKHQEIEAKWRASWEKERLHRTPENTTKEKKFYILPQLPYPSGAGLHVGHSEIYIACDIYSRFKRMQGRDVLQVIGWDSFGLPAENYAIKNNVHPKIITNQAIDNFRSQIKAMGVSVDWEHETGSHNPDYYHWTQWFFLLMYKNGLAYRKKQIVNWCEDCKTVLANEQVINGLCERSDTVVIQKEMEQWYLKITEYAEQLANDLDKVDWPAETVKRQRDWIGVSKGANVTFDVVDATGKKLDPQIEIFTTRVDTIYGVMALVVAPEHKLVQELKQFVTNSEEVQEYVAATALKTELQRQQDKEKTGVELKGIKAVSPFDGSQVPVIIADFAIATFGTGALFADAHDERDFEFALKFDLNLRPTIYTELHGKYIGFVGRKWSKDFDALLSKLAELKVTFKTKTADEAIFIIEKAQLESFLEFAKSNVNDQSWFDLMGDEYYYIRPGRVETLERFKDGSKIFAEQNELNSEMANYKNIWDMLYHSDYKEFVCQTGEGEIFDSGEFTGLQTPEAIDKMIAKLKETGKGSGKVVTRIRDWSVSRQRFWGAPIPMLMKELPDNNYTALILHGTGDSGKANWFPWLKETLEAQGHKAAAPDLPNNMNANYEERMSLLETDCKDYLGENSVVIGHSSGALAAMHVASKYKVRRLVLVSPIMYFDDAYKAKFAQDFGEKSAEDFAKYANTGIDHDQIKENATEIFIFFGAQDPYLPTADFIKFARETYPNAVLKIFKDKKHISKGDGTLEFPELLDFLPTSNIVMKPIPESDLPVMLPDDVDFKPTGQSPLNYSPSFQAGVEEKYGKGWKREVDTLDTFMCSSWYYYRYLDPKNDKAFASKELLETWMPVDFYLGGPEHVNGHLLYSRFFTKVLHDLGYVNFDEPFTIHRHQGVILGEDNRKMSKRWGNIINPTDIVNEFGADSLRVYEMFMGPLELTKSWNGKAVQGVNKFLKRIYAAQENFLTDQGQEVSGTMHKLIKRVGEFTENLRFNVAVSEFMKFMNELEANPANFSRKDWETFLIMFSAYAPYIAEELWAELGHTQSIHLEQLPQYDPAKITDAELNIAVQVNGKLRANMQIAADTPEAEVKQKALELDKLQPWIKDKEIKQVIYVAGRIVSIVV